MRAQETLDDAVLRQYLKEKLPPYMMPSAIVLLDKLPLTNNGKVNRAALPLPQTTRIHYAEPQNELEEAIAAVWRKVLRLEKVSIYDNFFDLGGHSLLLVQMHRGVREILKTQIPLVEMFRFPTINSLATHLMNKECVETGLDKIDDRARRREAALEWRRKVNFERRQS